MVVDRASTRLIIIPIVYTSFYRDDDTPSLPHHLNLGVIMILVMSGHCPVMEK